MTVVPLSVVRAGAGRTRPQRKQKVLLVGPYDPKGGEYTFLAPPLGVWRLAGVLTAAGVDADVFDPNCCESPPEIALQRTLTAADWTIVGFSTTGMTLQYDLALAHLAKAIKPAACFVAGGMEATFDPLTVMRLAPFDLIVLGEGEEPLRELVDRLGRGEDPRGIPGTAWRDADGGVQQQGRPALTRDALSDAIAKTPYERMPYEQYWERLDRSYRVGALPVKAAREARLAEIRSVRLITLNYCPMGCTFCSSTNFLHAAQGGQTARLSRLDEHETLAMVQRIVQTHPLVKTVIFQDDIFVFTQDRRILPLCDAIAAAKDAGTLPRDLQFISTNRIDAMTPERLAAMRRAGFRVLGFGIESFSLEILREFNKAQIHPYIVPMLREALRLGITPFLDMILTSPRCRLENLAENIRQAYAWVTAGCEVGMYPYVIPFSGAVMASDSELRPYTVYARREIARTSVSWDQPVKILPIDPLVRETILDIEAAFEERVTSLGDGTVHLPSRTRSLIWILSAIPRLRKAGFAMPSQLRVSQALAHRLPRTRRRTRLPRRAPARAVAGSRG